jgi:hypothetical protein
VSVLQVKIVAKKKKNLHNRKTKEFSSGENYYSTPKIATQIKKYSVLAEKTPTYEKKV